MIVKGGQRPNGHLSHREECGIQVLQLQPRLPANPLGLVLYKDLAEDRVLTNFIRYDEVRADDFDDSVISQDSG